MFQSTPPTRGATKYDPSNRKYLMFQSTPPTRGATRCKVRIILGHRCFNPRPPHGERPIAWSIGKTKPASFNPRSPHGERLVRLRSEIAVHIVSIHAPHTGSDISCPTGPKATGSFNPRPPHGERRGNLFDF